MNRIMLKAILYFNQIDYYKYLPQIDCGECGFETCKELLERLRTYEYKPEVCPYISGNMAYAFSTALNSEKIIPEIELMQLPVPAEVGLVEFNMPDKDSTLLISGNSELTQVALSAILSTTVKPFYVLFMDTKGDTMDMAVILKTFTPERVKNMIEDNNMSEKLNHREIIIPGFAEPLTKEIERLTGWKVNIGPVCCGELPLYLGKDWAAP
ncbi:MAG: (Fe-S)-binding protein [Pseudomonadota bacterium]